MTEEQEKKPKIVVDSDWKEQVQAEKEAAKKAAEKESTEQRTTDQLPPPSFPLLVSSLATQTLMAMGQIPDPDGKMVAQLDHAKHTIDMLAMLETKTKGNLTSEEEAMLDQVLHELRMAYVAISKNPAAAAQDPAATPEIVKPGDV
jgi:hypothetical protein